MQRPGRIRATASTVASPGCGAPSAATSGSRRSTLPLTAFDVALDQPGSVAGRTTEYLSWTPLTYTCNVTGLPAATVPCGFVAGLPVGLQVIGRRGADALVLRAAAAFE